MSTVRYERQDETVTKGPTVTVSRAASGPVTEAR